nr:CPPV015 hypothetical protein [Cooks petrelpox virus]
MYSFGISAIESSPTMIISPMYNNILITIEVSIYGIYKHIKNYIYRIF